VEPSIIARIDVTNVDRVIRHLRPLSAVLCERGTAGYFDLVEGGAAIIGNAERIPVYARSFIADLTTYLSRTPRALSRFSVTRFRLSSSSA
jgi:hypothetical protein